MKKRLLLIFMLMTLTILAFDVMSVSASNKLSYSVSDGEAAVICCETDAKNEIIIPSTYNGYPVTTIGEKAFEKCRNITSVVIPNTVTTIEAGAFEDCVNLYNIEIPNSVTTIGDWALSCTAAKSIYIPASVTYIGNKALSYNTHLINISVDSNNKYYSSDKNGVLYNKSKTEIIQYPIANTRTSFAIPDTVTCISDNYVFTRCYSLTEINIPNGVTYIGDCAFEWCIELTNVEIPDGVTHIGNSAFDNCSSLTHIEIPDSVTSIGDRAFLDCDNVTSIIIGDSVATIGDSAFENCSSLTHIEIPDSVTSIGNNAFDGCNKLENIKLSKNITSISDYMFSYCDNLTSIEIPAGVTSIGNSAFLWCSGLTNINIPHGVTTIGENAFSYCDLITSIKIPYSLKNVGESAFDECFSLEQVLYTGSESLWRNIQFGENNEFLTEAQIVYNAVIKTYKFVTNCEITLPDITDYAVFTSPIVTNGEKRFTGWYDNQSLSGVPVVFPYSGNATTLYAAWSDKSGTSFDDALTAKENRQYTVTTTEDGQIVYYEFVPKYTGEYRFYSTGSDDTFGYLYNSSRSQIDYDDDNGNEYNFYIEYELTAGETYYIGAKLYSDTGTFTLHIETDYVPGTKTVCVTASSGEKIFISIPSYLPKNSQVILACYKNDKFVEMETAPNKNETIYFIINQDFDTAKVMVWESFENMKPLCEVEVVQ